MTTTPGYTTDRTVPQPSSAPGVDVLPGSAAGHRGGVLVVNVDGMVTEITDGEFDGHLGR
jgi:hypothetical protein